ncbi:MAG: hypothetical protein ACLGIZ_14625 [Acidimicrobiia bacterium]
MRLERLVIGSGEHTLTADFHPELTVVGGLSPVTREAFAGELVDALAGGRPGVHLEVRAGGRSLTVFRPEAGRHRVIDTDSVRDVTAEHLGPDGEIDLFAAAGADRALARRTIRLTRDDLVPEGESEAWVARLAAVDQEVLWDTAMRCRAAERLLEQASAGNVSVDDAPIVRAVEERHAALVGATDSYERVRLISLTIGTIGALGGIGMVQLEDAGLALPFLLIALFGVVLALAYRRRVDDAAKAERAILRQAGADDYSTFHYERVSALLDTDHERRAFMRAVGDHRRAMTAWGEIAGDVSLTFALEHERAIRDGAELHARLGAHSPVDGAPTGSDVAAELAQAILARVRAVRALTPADTLPLIVDDPFDGLDLATKSVLLELLAAEAGSPQIVVVTADADVLRWAQGEASRGGLAVTGPMISDGAIAAPAG